MPYSNLETSPYQSCYYIKQFKTQIHLTAPQPVLFFMKKNSSEPIFIPLRAKRVGDIIKNGHIKISPTRLGSGSGATLCPLSIWNLYKKLLKNFKLHHFWPICSSPISQNGLQFEVPNDEYTFFYRN